ncbi:hypothetical protein SLS62_005510 [Diatrype stigma]|uniref:Uncharacterized protein n=1 Tax=Diatrype stigma TaxID=117547 RepID=A0AAN9USK7_9PEZI
MAPPQKRDNSDPSSAGQSKRRKLDSELSSNPNTAKARERAARLSEEQKTVEKRRAAMKAKQRRARGKWMKDNPDASDDEVQRQTTIINQQVEDDLKAKGEHPLQVAQKYGIALTVRSTNQEDWESVEWDEGEEDYHLYQDVTRERQAITAVPDRVILFVDDVTGLFLKKLEANQPLELGDAEFATLREDVAKTLRSEYTPVNADSGNTFTQFCDWLVRQIVKAAHQQVRLRGYPNSKKLSEKCAIQQHKLLQEAVTEYCDDEGWNAVPVEIKSALRCPSVLPWLTPDEISLLHFLLQVDLSKLHGWKKKFPKLNAALKRRAPKVREIVGWGYMARDEKFNKQDKILFPGYAKDWSDTMVGWIIGDEGRFCQKGVNMAIALLAMPKSTVVPSPYMDPDSQLDTLLPRLNLAGGVEEDDDIN